MAAGTSGRDRRWQWSPWQRAGYAGTRMEIWPGRPWPLGATPGEAGTNFAVVSEVAEQVMLCLSDEDGAETRLPLPGFDGGVWHGFVSAVSSGQRYGYRVTRPYNPARGLRRNPAKLLLDPDAKATAGQLVSGTAVELLPVHQFVTGIWPGAA